MCEFEVPRLLYYTHVPVLVAGLLLAFFVFFADKKKSENRNIFIFILFFCFWTTIDMVQWFFTDIESSLFVQRLSILEVISMLFFVYFVYSFLGERIGMVKKVLLFLPFIPVLAFVFTSYNLYIVNMNTCDADSGVLFWYSMALVVIYLIFSVILMVHKYRLSDTDNEQKRRIKIVISGIFFTVLWFVMSASSVDILIRWGGGYIADNISSFTPIGMLFFISMLVYAITKYSLFNIKLIAAQVLVVTLVILIGSEFFFIQNNTNRILTGLTLLLAVVFGWMLIKSVKLEVQRKEELQAMTDKLALANDQLRKLDNAKSEFISIASHQLRTPLTAVKGFVSLMLEGSYGTVDPKQKDVLNKVYQSNERLIDLVEDLLNLSRIESGRMEYNFEKVDMKAVCQEIFDTFIIKAKDKKLSLEYIPPKEALPQAMTDRNKIREIVSNLVDNAIKYTIEGGVKIRALQKEGMIRVEISDTGIGVPQEEVPYLFAKFSRGKDTSRLNTGGTGLGLHVGKKMIEELHGDLGVESEGAGKGSTFYVEVPVEIDK